MQDGTRERLSETEFAAAWARGSAMTLEDAVRLVRSEGISAPVRGRGDAGLPLAPRERQVAALVARGMTNRRIASELVVSERTAEAHAAHCLATLGLRSRSDLAAWAVSPETH